MGFAILFRLSQCLFPRKQVLTLHAIQLALEYIYIYIIQIKIFKEKKDQSIFYLLILSILKIKLKDFC